MVKERENFRAKTPSVWLESGRVFFGFLNRIEDRNLPKTLAVLGCSDGNYVLPAAKRGFKVLAIDIDRVALHGGVILLNGREVKVTGLTNRLKTEGVENQVTIVCDNCFPYNQRGTFSRVFTSGSIHYQDNSQYPLSQIINSIQSYVAPGGGILVMKYIHLSDENNSPLRHFVTGKEVIRFFPDAEWKITSNKKK